MKPLRCVTHEHYDSVLVALGLGHRAQLDVMTYQAENDRLRQAVGEKNILIQQLQQQASLQARMLDSFAVVARVFNSGINTQGKIIALQKSRDKSFAISIGAGYGAVMREGIVYGGPAVFAGIGWTIFRF